MIPKKIHYCWFGRGQKSDKMVQYMDSWKKFCPDYAIKEWNEDNFDIQVNKFVREAYRNHKFAFVSDYARLYALYTEGGIYLDTDVEVIRPLDCFLQHQSFSGFEDWCLIQTGILGAEKGTVWLKNEMNYYEKQSFIRWNGAFNVRPNTKLLTEHAFQYGFQMNGEYQVLNNGLALYPQDYFAPKSYMTHTINVTKNTCTIHHFAGSWNIKPKNELSLERYLGELWGLRVFKLYNLFRKILFRL